MPAYTCICFLSAFGFQILWWRCHCHRSLQSSSKVHGARLTGAALEIDAVSARVFDMVRQTFDITLRSKPCSPV